MFSFFRRVFIIILCYALLFVIGFFLAELKIYFPYEKVLPVLYGANTSFLLDVVVSYALAGFALFWMSKKQSMINALFLGCFCIFTDITFYLILPRLAFLSKINGHIQQDISKDPIWLHVVVGILIIPCIVLGVFLGRKLNAKMFS